MDFQVEWLKSAIKLCIKEFNLEQEKKNYFLELEKAYRGFTEEECKKIREIMKTKFEENDLVYVLSVIIQYMDIKAFKEELLEILARGKFDCLTSSVLEYQTVMYIKGEYKRKRILRRKNIERYKELLPMEYAYNQLEKRNQNRIVIVTGQILSALHAPSKIVMDVSYVLQKYMGYELLLFICPCDRYLPEGLWFRPCYENSNKKFTNFPVRIQVSDIILKGYQINMGESCGIEYNMMLDIIHSWNPLFVLDFATGNPIVEKVRDFTTLVSMPVSIECPISEAQILIRLDKCENELEEEYKENIGKKQVQLFMEERFPVVVEEGNSAYIRSELGLSEEKFLIAIVGNRLDLEIDLEFVLLIKKILKEVSNVQFAIIGETKAFNEYFKEEEFEERIKYLGFCNDLQGVYKVIDLYLNPRRNGGGFSSAMALMAGVPVITLPKCDVAYNCGKEFIVQNYEEMIEAVYKCVNEKEFYIQKKECAKKYREKNSRETLLCYVNNLVEKIKISIK